MGFELGPGFLRRPPSDWLPARAYPVQFRVTDWGTGTSDPYDLSVRLDAEWEVRIDGRQSYRFQEERRTAPTWCSANTIAGKRWYRVRVRGSHGLLRDVGVPAYVNPGNREDIWIDWDAAYDEHTAAWDQKDRVELAKARRASRYEGAVHRITSPFAGKLREGEEHLVDQAIAEDAAREAERAERDRPRVEAQLAAMGFAPIGDDEQARWRAYTEEKQRLSAGGREAPATVVALEETGRTLANIPVFLIHLDVHDGPAPRRLVYEHIHGPRHAKRYKPGKQIKVKVDVQDPDAIGLGS